MNDESSHEPRDRFYIARAEALNGYALMEKGLAFLFTTALNANPRYGTLIISKMINTRARNEVVQRIVDWETGNVCRLFTNPLFSMIASADGVRNKLVHWHVKERSEEEFVLIPTDVLSKSEAALTEQEIDAFNCLCVFIAAALGKFASEFNEATRDPALRGRFLQPLRYPPEPDDPLSRYYINSGGRPQSSRA
jgi:hypothetical protein